MWEEQLDYIENSRTLTRSSKIRALAHKYTVESLYSGHPWGAKFWPLYRGGLYWGVVLYTNCMFIFTWVPGHYIYRGGLYSGVAIKRGSTVCIRIRGNKDWYGKFHSTDVMLNWAPFNKWEQFQSVWSMCWVHPVAPPPNRNWECNIH